MKNGVIGTVISIVMVTLMLIIAPIAWIGIIDTARTESEVQSDVRNLIDEVIDSRKLTSDMLADFNLAMAAKNNVLHTTITREIKVVNPDPAHPGKTYTSYMVVDSKEDWNQGDLITVRVEQSSRNVYQVIADQFNGAGMKLGDIQFTGRVR